MNVLPFYPRAPQHSGNLKNSWLKFTKDTMLWTFLFSTITPLIKKHNAKVHGYLILLVVFCQFSISIYLQHITKCITFINNKKRWQPSSKLIAIFAKHHKKFHNKTNKPSIAKTQHITNFTNKTLKGCNHSQTS